MGQRSVVTFIALSLVGAACAGANTTARSSEPSPRDAAPSAPADGGAGHKSLADLRREFLDGCNAKVPDAPDFCACGWEQMTATFTEEELTAPGDEPTAKVAQLKQRVAAACKLPDEVIRRAYLKACDDEPPKSTPYCECKWTELRKKLSAAEIHDHVNPATEQFTAAHKVAVTVCGPKLPEDFVQQSFLRGCAKDPKLERFCTCAWKQIRAEKSPAEIEAGFLDMEAMRPKLDKACGKLRAP